MKLYDVQEAGEAALAKFVQGLAAEKRYPLPGEVHLVAGGPPCQGVSVAAGLIS